MFADFRPVVASAGEDGEGGFGVAAVSCLVLQILVGRNRFRLVFGSSPPARIQVRAG